MKKKRWLTTHLWSKHETACLLCGLDPEKANNPPWPWDQYEYNGAIHELNRAVLAEILPCIDPEDAGDADKLNGTDRFFKPADVIRWIKSGAYRYHAFTKFPFDINDALFATEMENGIS